MARSILICAGGTGGHLFPAEALAHEMKSRGWTIYLATDARAERFAGDFPAHEVFIIPSATVEFRNPIRFLRALWEIWRGVRRTTKLIGKIKPNAVVGFGGYPTLPPVWAATRRRIPTLIHEQNAVMGRANRALAPLVDRIAGGFLPATGKYGHKTIMTGNPVRPEIIEATTVPYTPASESFNLLVFGGSQGARFFADAIPAALADLPRDKQSRLKVTQQTRPEDESRVREAYATNGISAETSPFFRSMAEKIATAHLIISRSGASTVSEIAAIGRPALFVPYPHALDHDQSANAAALKAAGGAEVHEEKNLDSAVLASMIGEMMDDPARLARMAAAARSAGKPDAAHLLAEAVEAIAIAEITAPRLGETT